ncbi:MSP (Major sperm protein) domain-containing protein [Ditylenchus destructor]|nr:MSP (Major sperm protein) domain-containing protein [Ditylenchus destructor]
MDWRNISPMCFSVLISLATLSTLLFLCGGGSHFGSKTIERKETHEQSVEPLKHKAHKARKAHTRKKSRQAQRVSEAHNKPHMQLPVPPINKAESTSDSPDNPDYIPVQHRNKEVMSMLDEHGMSEKAEVIFRGRLSRANHRQSTANVDKLKIEPVSLRFTSSASKSQYLMVHNISNQRLAIKIRCSDNLTYHVNPVFSIIEAGKCVNVKVACSKVPRKLDKLVFVAIEAPKNLKDPRDVFRVGYDQSDAFLFVLSLFGTEAGRKICHDSKNTTMSRAKAVYC